MQMVFLSGQSFCVRVFLFIDNFLTREGFAVESTPILPVTLSLDGLVLCISCFYM